MSDVLFAFNILSLAICVVATVLIDRRMDRLQIAVLAGGNVAALFGIAFLPSVCIAIVLVLWAVDWKLRSRQAERDQGTLNVAAMRSGRAARFDRIHRTGDWSNVNDRDHAAYQAAAEAGLIEGGYKPSGRSGGRK